MQLVYCHHVSCSVVYGLVECITGTCWHTCIASLVCSRARCLQWVHCKSSHSTGVMYYYENVTLSGKLTKLQKLELSKKGVRHLGEAEQTYLFLLFCMRRRKEQREECLALDFSSSAWRLANSRSPNCLVCSSDFLYLHTPHITSVTTLCSSSLHEQIHEHPSAIRFLPFKQYLPEIIKLELWLWI